MIKRKGKAGVYWIDTRINGERVRRSLHTQDEQEAKRLAAEYVAGVRMETPHGAQRITLLRAHRRAVAEHWQGTKGLRTVERNAHLSMEVLGADTLVAHVGQAEITKLVNHYRAAGNKDSSINRKLSWLGKLLRLCHQWGYIAAVPHVPRFKENKGRMRVLSGVEERELLARAVAHGWTEEADLWKCLLDTGCRLSELLRLRHKDVQGADINLWDTKNGSFRTVPLTHRAAALIRSRATLGIRADSSPVFFAERNYPQATDAQRHSLVNTIGDRWNIIRAEMGLKADPEFVIHALRHTFASRLVRAGVDLYVVQRLLGHASIKQTEVYAKLHSGNLSAAVEVLNHAQTYDHNDHVKQEPGTPERKNSKTNSWLQPVVDPLSEFESLLSHQKSKKEQ